MSPPEKLDDSIRALRSRNGPRAGSRRGPASTGAAPWIALALLAGACGTPPAPEAAPPPGGGTAECCADDPDAFGPASPPVAPAQGPPDAAAADEEAAARRGGRLASRTGAWELAWQPDPAPLPEGEPFDLVVTLRSPSGEPAELSLDVDAGMPSHGHGMNRRARVERTGPCRFRARGLLFHMPGPWVLSFDVTRGAVTERVEQVVVLP